MLTPTTAGLSPAFRQEHDFFVPPPTETDVAGEVAIQFVAWG
jgi:hypothetical protein